MLYHLESKLNSQNDQTGYFNRITEQPIMSGLFCFGYFYFKGKNKSSLRMDKAIFADCLPFSVYHPTRGLDKSEANFAI